MGNAAVLRTQETLEEGIVHALCVISVTTALFGRTSTGSSFYDIFTVYDHS
jgi:hypothetical protein